MQNTTNNESKLHLFTDETSRPYEKNENKFIRTPQFDELEAHIIQKYNLTLAEDKNKTKT